MSNRINYGLLCLLFIAFGCKNFDDTNSSEQYYFAIKNYFENESKKFAKTNKPIIKTVSRDGIQEKKVLKVKNWENEFSLFVNSDINKSSWKNLYREDSLANKISYTALDASLVTKSIDIFQLNNKIISIRIHNSAKNYIVDKDEVLQYYPDSLYVIEKSQKILFGKKHTYKVVGQL